MWVESRLARILFGHAWCHGMVQNMHITYYMYIDNYICTNKHNTCTCTHTRILHTYAHTSYYKHVCVCVCVRYGRSPEVIRPPGKCYFFL